MIQLHLSVFLPLSPDTWLTRLGTIPAGARTSMTGADAPSACDNGGFVPWGGTSRQCATPSGPPHLLPPVLFHDWPLTRLGGCYTLGSTRKFWYFYQTFLVFQPEVSGEIRSKRMRVDFPQAMHDVTES